MMKTEFTLVVKSLPQEPIPGLEGNYSPICWGQYCANQNPHPAEVMVIHGNFVVTKTCLNGLQQVFQAYDKEREQRLERAKAQTKARDYLH